MKSDNTSEVEKLIKKVNGLLNTNDIIIHEIDFNTDEITVSFVDPNQKVKTTVKEPKEFLQRITFFNLTKRIVVKKACFDTGKIKIIILNEDKHELLTPKEIDLLRNGKRIEAIKEVRARTGFGLADAKKLTDDAIRTLGL